MKATLFLSVNTIDNIEWYPGRIGAAEYEAGTQIALPEGALARLGKGDARMAAFSPDGRSPCCSGINRCLALRCSELQRGISAHWAH